MSSTIDSIAKSKLPALGIDLGGTKIRGAVVCDNNIVGEPRQIPTPGGRDAILAGLIELTNSFQKDHSIAGVGVATAGIVDCTTGEIIGSTGNLPGWSGTKLKQEMEGKILLPVHVENDANAAGYAEAKVPDLKDKKCVVTVTLGTGIGGGIVLDGRLYRGPGWAAGEVGHIRISMDGKRSCTCGLYDCWEAFGSGRGLLITAHELLVGLLETQTPLAAKQDKLTTHDIFAAAKEDDILAQKIVDQWHQHVAHGLVCLAHVLNPDCFVLTGGLADHVDFPHLTDIVKDRCLPRVGDVIDIRHSQLEGHAGIIGAAQFLIDELTTARN